MAPAAAIGAGTSSATAHCSFFDPQEQHMTKMPPVPEEQRSQKGPGSDPAVETAERVPGRENFETQGRHGNIKQNTTNQGYQQDR
jgi:hypothetical protein